jgi:hypothetical protein
MARSEMDRTISRQDRRVVRRPVGHWPYMPIMGMHGSRPPAQSPTPRLDTKTPPTGMSGVLVLGTRGVSGGVAEGYRKTGSSRNGSASATARSPDWLQFKNPAAPAVKREA